MQRFYSSQSCLLAPNFASRIAQCKALLRQRKERLLFIADFDHTLTTMTSDQCHHAIGFNPLLSKTFRDGFHQVVRTEVEDWAQWWFICHDYIVNHSDLTLDLFREGLRSSNFQLRDQCSQLFRFLTLHNIPTYIVSAGVQNVIEDVFEKHDIDLGQNSYFYTNKMIFDDDNNLAKFTPSVPVHSLGKHMLPFHFPEIFSRTVSVEIPSLQTVFQYDVAIVLGDSVGDFQVVRELSHFETIKIGFAGNEDKAQYLMDQVQCDVVLFGKEHDISSVLELLQDLVGTP